MATTERNLQHPTDSGPRLVETSDIITIDEVARRLDISKSTLYGWRHKHTGPPSHRAGKRLRWSEVLHWLDNQDWS